MSSSLSSLSSRRLRKAASASVSLLTAASLLLQTSYAVYAQAVVADPSAPAANLPQVTSAGNGVPLVNIVTPNGAGLSHNKFSDFNVGTQGLILNNARTIGQSQLGGMVVANPNLAASPEARLILNEVTSTNPSLLQGATEVHGVRADFILANPNGITCNGCGFIGTPRATLTTGAPVLDPASGALTGFSVDRGTVTIGAMGLDARQTDYFDIISRGLAINGVLHGQDVSVITGRNDVDYATRAVKAVKADDGSEKPEFSIDSSALGGMYAGRIALEGTEAGVGVRTPQNMSAGGGGMVLTADGKLVLQKTVSQGAIKARSRSADVTVKGNLHAGTSLDLQGATAIRVLEHVVAGAQRDVTLKSGGDVSLKGDVLAAGLAGDGSVSQSTGKLGIEAGGNVDVAASQTLSAGETITLTGGGSLASSGKITSGSLSIALGGGQPGASRNALTTSTGSLLLARSGPLTISAGDWTHAGTAGAAGNASAVLSGALVSSAGSLILAEGGALGLSAAAMDHAGKLEAGSSLTLILAGNLAARGGSLMAAHSGSMVVNAANWTHGGEATASGALTAGLSGALNTQADSLILAQGGNLTLNAGSWSHAGQAAATGTISAVLSGALETHAASLVQAQTGALDLRAASWRHAGEASAHTVLTAAMDGAVQTTAGSLILAGAGGLALAAGSLAHTGQAGAEGSVTVTLSGDGTVLSGGRLVANSGSLAVDAGHLAHAGELAAGAALALRLRGALDSAAGSIVLAEGGNLQLEAARWTHGGQATAGGRVAAVIGGAVETLAESLILAEGGDLDLTAATLIHGGRPERQAPSP
ncbi:filamentous hemagglutinin N-terminal domain-containing protein [Pannonibacter phragmitetus]|uniref:two-partner secretion domain-containing protein n=1 Tax=Pannonibacter phragmitetus TaxID=121719 RepID=UPI003D2EF994